MLVAALARALRERQLLIEDVSSEREALKETVATLESTRHQLTLSQKQELVSQMAGGIAHDMNNALTVILGEASFLDDSAAEGRERILDAGAHAAQLTRQLMVFGRKDISQPRPIDLAVTLSSFQQSIERIMPSDIQVESSLIDQPVVVEADPNQLLQVVLNLASNAKDAMPGGGQLTISLKTDHQEKLALLTVSDTGEGIEEEMLEQIFDPFFTTKRPGKGTGLGLASVRNLIDQMGGSVHVVSQPGRGTSFEIRLPLSDAQPSERPVSESLAPSRTGVVLVVDDDVRVRAMIFTALERIGCHVLEAADPEGAGKAARGREQIDLLITDVVMAGGGGAEAIRRVKAESPMTRVLVMSGYADDEAVRRGISLGEYPFLPKPFTADELTAAVDAVLDESAEENQPSR
jgi:CheY-like chemotaxis protein